MAASPAGRPASSGEAESIVGEQLCTTELESQSWRLRCFQAEAQLRLLRLKRRGEQHARWPQDSIARQQLLASRASLEAANPSSGSKEALQSLVRARSAVGQLQDQLQNCADDLSRLREETAEQQDLATRLTEGQAAEDASFLERELELAKEKEEVKLFAEQLRLKFARENELAERLALDQDACEQLKTELEDGQPALQQLQEEAKQARTESDRARLAAQRRREAVGKLEEEVEQADHNAEEEHQALQRRLEDCHTELKDVIDNTAEIGEQTRKAHIFQGRQLKEVKEGGTALRGAVQNFGQESEDIRSELERLRYVVGSAAAADAERREREQVGQETLEALNSEVQDAQLALKQAQEAYAQASGSEAEAVKAGVLQATGALKKAEEVATTAASDETEASELLQVLQKEKARLRGETGPEAAQRRADEAEAWRAESVRLAEEMEDIKAQLNTAQEKLDRQRRQREAQRYARQAAKEAAVGIRGSYASLQRRPPGTARSATPSTSSSEFPAVGKAVKKLSQHLDDFTRFVEEAMSLSDVAMSAGEPLDAVVNLKLPVALRQVYLGKFTQTEAGRSQAQLLAAEREKLKALSQQNLDSNSSHKSECTRLSGRAAELRSAISDCAKRREEDTQKMEEARAQLQSDVTSAGFQRTQAQMLAVSQVQKELAEHELELAKMRQERQTLQASKAKNSQAPSPTASKRVINGTDAGPSLELLRQKDAELQGQRKRLAGARERYSSLVAEAGGKEAVEELGLDLPVSATSPGQPRSRSRTASPSGALSPLAAASSVSPRQGEDQPSPGLQPAACTVPSVAATPDAPAGTLGTAATAIPASPVGGPVSPGKLPAREQSYMSNLSFQEVSASSAPPPRVERPCLLVRAPSSGGEGFGGPGADDSSPGSSMSKRTRRSSALEAAAMAAGQAGASPTRRAAAAMAASAAAIANAPTPPTPTHGTVVYAAQAAVAAAIATVRPGGKAAGKAGSSLSEEMLQDLIEAGVLAASGSGDKAKSEDFDVSRLEAKGEGVHLPSTPPQRPGPRAALSMSWFELEGAALEPSPHSSDRIGGSDLASPSKLSAALAEIREADVEASADPLAVDGIQASEPSPLSDRRSEFAWGAPAPPDFVLSQASSPYSHSRDAPVVPSPTSGLQALLSPRTLLPCQARRPMACGLVSPPRHISPSILRPVRAMPAIMPAVMQQAMARSTSWQGGLLLQPQGFIQAVPNIASPLASSCRKCGYFFEPDAAFCQNCGMQREIGSSRSRSGSPMNAIGSSRSRSGSPMNAALKTGMSWSAIASDALSPVHVQPGVFFERMPTEASASSSMANGTWDRQSTSSVNEAKLQPAPSWARKALDPGGKAPVMPPPSLPPLQELFEFNMTEQAEERRLRQQQQERKLRSSVAMSFKTNSLRTTLSADETSDSSPAYLRPLVRL